MSIYQEGKYESEVKCFMLTQVVGSLLTISILSKEFLAQLIPSLQQGAQSMVKRGDQCDARSEQLVLLFVGRCGEG